jgi:hypothetical protein
MIDRSSLRLSATLLLVGQLLYIVVSHGRPLGDTLPPDALALLPPDFPFDSLER